MPRDMSTWRLAASVQLSFSAFHSSISNFFVPHVVDVERKRRESKRERERKKTKLNWSWFPVFWEGRAGSFGVRDRGRLREKKVRVDEKSVK